MVRNKIEKTIKRIVDVEDFVVESPDMASHGDYATNVALVLSKKEKRDPRKTAEEIVKKILNDKKLSEYIAKIDVAGPGFINFWLSDEYLLSEAEKIISGGGRYAKMNLGKGLRVVVEYSSPNIAKRFSVGHLRSTIIGQALNNLYKQLGYEVIGDNHIGDWGTQFGAILYEVTQSGKNPKDLSLDEMEGLYLSFTKKARKDENLRGKAREWFKKLEDGNETARKIWKTVVDISTEEFNRIYKLLGVEIDHTFGESFYEDKMPEVINEVREKRLSKESDGAVVVEFDQLTPAMLIKSDGATTYFTRDLATLKFRIDKWNPQKIVYEVGSEQKLHFKQVFKAGETLGWTDGVELVHVPHGLVRDKSGKKMSTRLGTTIKLEDILKEAVDRAKKIIETSETGRGLRAGEKEEVAQAVGIGAIKYFDLSHHPTSDIMFDWERIFVLEGNSAPYLQYTIARINSVLLNVEDIDISKQKMSFNSEEQSVIRKLPRFKEVLVDAAHDYSPNLLCNYLFDLAQKYNHFYSKHKILGSDNEKIRLTISRATGIVLKTGLSLLGIDSPRRM